MVEISVVVLRPFGKDTIWAGISCRVARVDHLDHLLPDPTLFRKFVSRAEHWLLAAASSTLVPSSCSSSVLPGSELLKEKDTPR